MNVSRTQEDVISWIEEKRRSEQIQKQEMKWNSIYIIAKSELGFLITLNIRN